MKNLEEWVGVDPLALNLTTRGGAFAMAMFDIAAKALAVPAHKLTGSRNWDEVPVGWWSPPLEPTQEPGPHSQ